MKSVWLQNLWPALVKNCYSEVALTTTALAGLLRVCFSISPGKFAQGFKVFCRCARALCQPCFCDIFRKLHGDLYSLISVPAAARGELQPPPPHQRLPPSPLTLTLAIGEDAGRRHRWERDGGCCQVTAYLMKQCSAAGAAWPAGTISDVQLPGRMWFLGFAPSTPFLPIFPRLHSAGVPGGKGAGPTNTSHTCQWVAAAWFTAWTSRNFSLPYCTFYSWFWGVLRGALSQEDKNWAFSASVPCSRCPSACGALHKPAFLEKKHPLEQ